MKRMCFFGEEVRGKNGLSEFISLLEKLRDGFIDGVKRGVVTFYLKAGGFNDLVFSNLVSFIANAEYDNYKIDVEMVFVNKKSLYLEEKRKTYCYNGVIKVKENINIDEYLINRSDICWFYIDMDSMDECSSELRHAYEYAKKKNREIQIYKLGE